MSLLDAVDLLDDVKGAGGDGVVQAQHHDGVTPDNAASHLHGSNVHIVLTKERAEMTNDPGHVAVPGEEHVLAGGHVEGELIDAGDAQLSIGKDRTGGGMAAVGVATGQTQ